MKILVAHPGTQHAHHLVSGLMAAGVDVRYHTIMQFGKNSAWNNFVTNRLISKRSLNNIADKNITRHPLLELIPNVLKRFNVSDPEAYARRNRMFQEKISVKDLHASSAVIGFDSSSLVLAKKCREAHVPFFLELTTPHSLEKQKWSEYLHDNYPQWPAEVLQKPEALIREEDEEVDTATLVSAPSKYVANTHYKHGRYQKEIVINPFGADVSAFRPKRTYNASKPKFVFMGAINAAKGLPVLLEAWTLAQPDATLEIAGYGQLPASVKLPVNVSFVGRIQKNERETFFHSADVLICPSLYEGLALVQLEAAACGLAVIGTHNSGGSEFLDDNISGYFVEAGNVAALAEKMSSLAADAVLRRKMGEAAALKAQQYTWDAYAMRWIQSITNSISQRTR